MNMFRKSGSRSNVGVSTVPKMYASVSGVTELVGVYSSKMFKSTAEKFSVVVSSLQQEMFNHPVKLTRQTKLQKFVMTFEDGQQAVFDDDGIIRHQVGMESYYVCLKPMIVLLDLGSEIHRVLVCFGWQEAKGFGAIFNFNVKSLPEGFKIEMLRSEDVFAFDFYEEQKLIREHGSIEAEKLARTQNVKSLIYSINNESAKLKADGGVLEPGVEAMLNQVENEDDETTLEKLYNTVLVARAKFQEKMIAKLLDEKKGKEWIKNKASEVGVVSDKWGWMGRQAIEEDDTKRLKGQFDLAEAMEQVKHFGIAREMEREKAREKLRKEREGKTIWFGAIN